MGTVDLNKCRWKCGFKSKDLNTKLVGTLNNFYFNGFVFDKINLNGQLEKLKFTRKVNHDDSCMLLKFDGVADFNDSIPKYDFLPTLKNADLHKLNLTKDTSSHIPNGKYTGTANDKHDYRKGKSSNIILQNAKDILALSDVSVI